MSSVPRDVNWLIIGGGIHGVHIAARLLGEDGISPAQLRIVDPADRLLDRWRVCTTTTGMAFLRSPSVHNLDLDPFSLLDYAEKEHSRTEALFAPPYSRPALSLFNEHADRVIDAFGLEELHIQDRAVRISITETGVAVELSDGSIVTTEHVVLALGPGDQPEWPDWAPRQDPRISHVFDPGFDAWPAADEAVLVIGGGISAVQVALRLVDAGNRVHLVARHPFREHQFDSDPGWLGKKYMAAFLAEHDMAVRREMVTEARNRGSMPPDVFEALDLARRNGSVQCHQDDVRSVNVGKEGLTIYLDSGAVLQTQRVLLATGFACKRPGGTMIDTLVVSASLPCAACGFPQVDEFLRWHPRIFVSGALAELELGPTARNIAGARRAAEKVCAFAMVDASDSVPS